MHLADAFIQSDLIQSIIFLSVCFIIIDKLLWILNYYIGASIMN